jgi:hypothetical protein
MGTSSATRVAVSSDARAADADATRWRDGALCRQMGPAAFYSRATAAALALCKRCPVDETCFWFALVIEERAGYRFGVWGGTTPARRAEIAHLVGPGYALGRLADLLGTKSVAEARKR